ncbi:glycosyltransferase family 4 protein [Frateuria sp. YIM B11624]|uniref:glycosyltransferase family 4 protein n=1 Tax=Frateuria sp. YIM B11624 TaxID=3143185 RepID=UPI003C78ED03
MRIGIVSETYPPEINGVALTVQGLAIGLAARGHTIELVRPRQHQRSPVEPGVLVQEVRGMALPRYPGLRMGWPAGRLLHERWRRLPPDALYIATEGPLGRSALRAAGRLGIPVATGFHTRFDDYAAHYGVGALAPAVRRYLCRFHRRSDATLVPTNALADELRGLGVANVRVLRRAVDSARFHPALRDASLRTAWGADGSTPVVLYVGRIAPEKNLELAVQTFRAIQQQVPGARYVWVGDGPARAALAAAHPDFLFVGTQQGDALARHYASADLFSFPSLSETFGNVVIEALAAGLPVVAFDQGAAREHLQHGSNGYCIALGDEAAFVAAAVTLAGNPGLIRHVGRAARASIERLSPAAVLSDFENLLRGLSRGERQTHVVRIAHA